MELVEVSDQQQAAQVIPNRLFSTRTFGRTGWVVVSAILGAFAYVAVHKKASSHQECIDWSDHADPQAPSIASKFELGLDTVVEWFPENAQQIIANKKEIITHMVDITDPEPDSQLRTLKLAPHRDELDLGNPGSSEVGTTTTSTAMTTTLPPAANCTEALADFMHSSLQFVAGFARFKIPHRHAFRIALVAKIHMLKREQYFALINELLSWIQARGTREKSEKLWKLMKKSWTIVKFMFEWTVKTRSDPWETMKESVRLASQFVLWFKSDSPQAFIAAVGLQLAAAHDTFLAERSVRSSCNATLSDFLDPRGLMKKTVLL
jgi:hypothetical protein